MMRRHVGTFLLGVLMCAPGVIEAKDKDKHHFKRYYDRSSKDYHEWNEQEERAYRHWLQEERHLKYQPWAKARRNQQMEYWTWRHQHSDWH